MDPYLPDGVTQSMIDACFDGSLHGGLGPEPREDASCPLCNDEGCRSCEEEGND